MSTKSMAVEEKEKQEQEQQEKIPVVTGSSSSKNENPPSTRFPTLHHIGIMTRDIKKMTDWYAKVLGMKSNFDSSSRVPNPDGRAHLQVNLITNDGADHRIALLSMPGLIENKEKSKSTKIQHVAFVHRSIGDLLNSYSRLKDVGIVPVVVMNHARGTSFYYRDPESNSVELFIYNFGNWGNTDELLATIDINKFEITNVQLDPEEIIAAQKDGLPDAQIHQYINSGKFVSSNPVDGRTLL